MREKSTCEYCNNEFEWKKYGKMKRRFCSQKCRHDSGGTGAILLPRFKISDMTVEEKLERLKKSFEKHVIRKEGCWGWKGPKDDGGYPVMSCRRAIGSDRGHKASWIIYNGEITKHMHVCHKCDNPICTNPEHLWLGTHKQNNDDKIEKGRARYAAPPIMKGNENPSAKLNEEQVKDIKNLIKNGRSSYSIGKDYNVSKTTILRIKNGKNWSHIPC